MSPISLSPTLTVNLGDRSHPVYVGAHILERLDDLIKIHAPEATG